MSKIISQAAEKLPDTTTDEQDVSVAEVSLSVKGLLAFIAVAIYAVLLTAFTFDKKEELVNEFENLKNLYHVEEQLRQVEATAFHIVMAVFLNSNSDDHNAVVQRFKTNLALLKGKNEELIAQYPAAGINLRRLEDAVNRAAEFPAENDIEIMNSELLKVKIEITRHIDTSRREQEATAEHFHMLWDSAALASLLFGLIGLFLLGAIIGLFFTRLTNDLHILKGRALSIIRGEREGPMKVTRNDEVGALMQSINKMAKSLDEREKELVIARQKYFHQEKMAAVGGLAAGVAHEIGNPIAAMSGVLQEMIYEQSPQQDGSSGNEKLKVMQTQIKRLSLITREISEFASPQPIERQLLGLNALVRTTAGLISYDQRFGKVKLRLDLDNQLPAIIGVADHLTQVIMNLLINAADALVSVEEHEKEVAVNTKVIDENILLIVSDNGKGMDQETLNRVFEAFFTTKRKGNGLGMSLCYSIIEGHGGTIEINSVLGEGTQVQVILPIPEALGEI
jgi:signal transduction histidine kinase